MRNHVPCTLLTLTLAVSLFCRGARAQTAENGVLPQLSLPASTSAGDAAQQTDSALPQTSPLTSQSGTRPNAPNDRAGVFSKHMVDRARQILVLRRLLALRFTTDDFGVALPLLRRLNAIKAAPAVDPEQALEAEYEALLTTNPGDPLPPSSALKIVDAARFYREEQAKIWSEAERKLGKTKAEGLQSLLGQSEQTGSATSLLPLPGNNAPRPNGPPPENQPSAANANRQAASSEHSLFVYSLTTVRISLSELLDLMQAKLDATTRTNKNRGLRP